MADTSQYFHRLRLDLDSVAMTKAIWRQDGIGGTGPLVTMIVPSASMGLTPVPSLASHYRARTADLMDDEVAKKSVKVCVVGNPANTNALICSQYAPSIPRENFSAMTRLDENRAISMISDRTGVHSD